MAGDSATALVVLRLEMPAGHPRLRLTTCADLAEGPETVKVFTSVEEALQEVRDFVYGLVAERS